MAVKNSGPFRFGVGMGFLFILLLIAFFWAEKVRTFPDPRANVRILDRNGRLLAQQASEKYGLRTWIPLEGMAASLIEAVLNQEDRRFYRHFGVDPFATLRALTKNLRGGAPQGGSTITQQLAKILLENWRGGRTPRSLFWKTAEAVVALDCELHWSKRDILERYLNSVYLGQRLYGVEAASQAYFGKSARDLSQEESVALAGHLRRPNQEREILVLPQTVFLAPHLAQMSLERLHGVEENRGSDRVVRTSLDAEIQTLAARTLSREMHHLRETDPKLQGAVVVVDVDSGELKALVGSEDFGDASRAGQVNHALALRQPGSTLKPFTYFLAFLHHRNPASLVLDAPYHFYLAEDRNYTPRNFDRRYHGLLSIREALANSYNIPAVLTLAEMGTSYYLELLHRFGLLSLKESYDHYGLALTLGSGSVTLLELTQAYRILAKGGEGEEERKAAFLVTDILSDPEARRRAFGDAELMSLDRQPAAVKTGTSHDSRDAWALGYTPRYAVGVWAGHPDNSPMPGLTGAAAAVPIWHGVMARLHEGLRPLAFQAPPGLERRAFCRADDCGVAKADWTGKETPFRPQVPPPEESFRLLAPTDGDRFLIDGEIPRERQKIFCQARLSSELQKIAREEDLPLRWLIDGKEVARSQSGDPRAFLDLAPGRYELRAAVGEFKTRAARVRVEEVAAP